MLVAVMAEMIFQPVRTRYMILFVTQTKISCSIGERNNLSVDGICTAFLGKIIWCLSDASQMQYYQHLKGCKIYLNLFYLYSYFYSFIKPGISLCHLLSGFSYWDLIRVPPHFSPTHPQCRALTWRVKVPRYNLLHYSDEFKINSVSSSAFCYCSHTF